RRDLRDALLARCRSDAHIRLIAGTRIVDFRQTGERVFAIAAPGERYEGAALVGADGLRSNIRERIIGDGEPKVSGHVSYRAVLPAEDMPEELRWNAATLWAGPNTHLVHYPLRASELFNIVITFHSKTEEHGAMNVEGSREEVMAYFGDIAERPRRILERPKAWRRWSLCYRDPVENWTDGRATLLGDAAHPMLQYFAQGACMALEDAVCLARCAADHDFPRAFVDYQNARLVRTGRVALSAMMLGHFFHASGGARLVRNGVFQQRTPEAFYDGLAWLYGGPE
ncbi:MAG: FAD-dependent monooxygenase, partial [Proteobacteria bacterium]|nr:FAD-dependent monooxygenase [Pseudomonadota bacterium]